MLPQGLLPRQNPASLASDTCFLQPGCLADTPTQVIWSLRFLSAT